MSKLFALLFVLLTGYSASAETRIAILGDSLAVDCVGCWAQLLMEEPGLEVADSAWIGTTSKGWWVTLQSLYRPTPVWHLHGIVDHFIISLGSNDAKVPETQAAFAFWINAVVNTLRDDADEIDFLLVPEASGGEPYATWRPLYWQVLLDLCTTDPQIGCIDARDMPLYLFPPNDPHPTLEGHLWLLDRVLEFIEAN